MRSTLRTQSIVLVYLSTGVALGANLGQWSPKINLPLVPVAAAILPNTGDVLLWSAFSNSAFQINKSGQTQTVLYNPSTKSISQYTVSNTQHDMFCPGISLDFDGRVIVTGGDTAQKMSIQSGGDTSWYAGPNMQIARGYQSSVTLSDGRIFVIGGSWSGPRGGKNGEVYDGKSNTWTLLPRASVTPMLTADAAGAWRTDNHGWLFAWKNGFAFQAGPSRAMNWYGTYGSGSVQGAGKRADDNDAMNGNAVMYDAVAGKILSIGGAPSYQDSTGTSNAHIITIGAPNTPANVQRINSMANKRAFASAVVLPNGQVFINGGQTVAKPFSDVGAIMTPELWDPNTRSFSPLAGNVIPRTYHSFAILLPDATVLVGGGGLCGATCAANHFDTEVFTPPYLYKSDGKTLATRPKILSSSGARVKVGGSITITMDRPVPSFALVRLGSNTHTVNTDQRRVPLVPRAQGNVHTVVLPNDAGILVPGYWMLFALDNSGVPSISKMVKVTP